MFNFFNEKEDNKIYYCKHIAPGVCAYDSETILIGEETLKEMDKTFAGKPIYISHQKVNKDTMKQDAVGYVVESFYFPEDGNHWAKMLVLEDIAHDLIRRGIKVSNAYQPESFSVGGEWHNVPYQREVTKAKYTHLALVDNPRYEDAVIMTPDEFKKYKEAKKEQLAQMQNSKPEKSKQGEQKMFKLWTKKEVTNSEDISNVMVELSNGSTVSIAEMVNSVEADLKKEEEAKNKCNSEVLESVVKVNGDDMTVKDLIAAFEKKNKRNKKNADDAEDEEKKDEKEEEDKESCKNDDGEEKKDKKDCKNAEDEEKDGEEDEEKKDKKNSKDLLEAEEKANAKNFKGQVVDTMARKLARGVNNYGSAK